jgi:hypothetical protein
MSSASDAARPAVHAAFEMCHGVLGVPQYQLRAIEGGLLKEVHADVARRYFHFLGIDAWVADWCRANRDLATRVGLLGRTRTRSSRR